MASQSHASPFFRLSLELRNDIYAQLTQPLRHPVEHVAQEDRINPNTEKYTGFVLPFFAIPDLRLVSRHFRREYEDEVLGRALMICKIHCQRPFTICRMQDSWFTRTHLDKVKEVHFDLDGLSTSQEFTEALAFSHTRTDDVLSLLPGVQRVAYTISFWRPHFEHSGFGSPLGASIDPPICQLFSPRQWQVSCFEQARKHGAEGVAIRIEISDCLFEMPGQYRIRSMMSDFNHVRYLATPSDDPNAWYGLHLTTLEAGSFEATWKDITNDAAFNARLRG